MGMPLVGLMRAIKAALTKKDKKFFLLLSKEVPKEEYPYDYVEEVWGGN